MGIDFHLSSGKKISLNKKENVQKMDKELIKQVVKEMVDSGELYIGLKENENESTMITLYCGHDAWQNDDDREYEGVEVKGDSMDGFPREVVYPSMNEIENNE